MPGNQMIPCPTCRPAAPKEGTACCPAGARLAADWVDRYKCPEHGWQSRGGATAGEAKPIPLRAMTAEELERYKPITPEQIAAAVAKGAADRWHAEHPTINPALTATGDPDECNVCGRDAEDCDVDGTCQGARSRAEALKVAELKARP